MLFRFEEEEMVQVCGSGLRRSLDRPTVTVGIVNTNLLTNVITNLSQTLTHSICPKLSYFTIKNK